MTQSKIKQHQEMLSLIAKLIDIMIERDTPKYGGIIQHKGRKYSFNVEQK